VWRSRPVLYIWGGSATVAQEELGLIVMCTLEAGRPQPVPEERKCLVHVPVSLFAYIDPIDDEDQLRRLQWRN
jgi:hypothetical protein